MTLYYLVKQHTNERITTRGGDPLILQEEALEDAILDLERRMPGLGSLEPMTLREFFEVFHVPAVAAKRDALKLLDAAKEATE